MFENKVNDIANEIVPYLPDNWERIVLHGYFTDTGYLYYFYVKVDNEYINCLEMEKYGISEKEIYAIQKSLYNICKAQKVDFHSFDLEVESNGKFKMHYNYGEQLGIREWKEKFLNDDVNEQ